jgi:hypothetical protein
MLSGTHFYHRITRKMVVGFGSLFNNLRLVRYAKNSTTEIERITVPLSYMSKEKFYQRLVQDPGLDKEVQITLPRMTFEMTAISYDPVRKMSSFNTLFAKPNAAGQDIRAVTYAPYNFDFTLNIFVRNTEDGTQIIEQILPYFTPDYTVTVDLLGENTNLPVDVPIVLNTVNFDPSEETGTGMTLRTLNWTLTFTMKGYLYGRVNTDAKIITTSTANVFNDQVSTANEYDITLGAGSGEYKLGELVFQGRNPIDTNASAFVQSWDSNANVLIVTDKTGTIQVGKYITGAVTNASYNVASITPNSATQLSHITVTPLPNTANVQTAFGFDTEIEEFPNIT